MIVFTLWIPALATGVSWAHNAVRLGYCASQDYGPVSLLGVLAGGILGLALTGLIEYKMRG